MIRQQRCDNLGLGNSVGFAIAVKLLLKLSGEANCEGHGIVARRSVYYNNTSTGGDEVPPETSQLGELDRGLWRRKDSCRCAIAMSLRYLHSCDGATRNVNHVCRMAGRCQKALEVCMRDHHRRAVDERMCLDCIGFPQRAIDIELYGMREIVDQREQCHRSGRDAEMASKALGGREAGAGDPDHLPQRIEIDHAVRRYRHEDVPHTLLVAKEEVLGLCRRERRDEPVGFLDRHHRRVFMAREANAGFGEEVIEVHRVDCRA